MARSESPPQFLLAAQVASRLHVSPKTVSRWATEGKLPYVRTLGGHRRFDPREITALIERLGLNEHEQDGGQA